jgi:hypothetical protein
MARTKQTYRTSAGGRAPKVNWEQRRRAEKKRELDEREADLYIAREVEQDLRVLVATLCVEDGVYHQEVEALTAKLKNSRTSRKSPAGRKLKLPGTREFKNLTPLPLKEDQLEVQVETLRARKREFVTKIAILQADLATSQMAASQKAPESQTTKKRVSANSRLPVHNRFASPHQWQSKRSRVN